MNGKNHVFGKIQNPAIADQGFTLLEVLVGILMATTFTLVAMQALVSAIALKVQARRVSEAANWIRESYEEIKYDAANYGHPLFPAACEETSSDPGGSSYAAYFSNHIGRGTTELIKPLPEDGGRRYILRRTVDMYDEDYGYAKAPYNMVKVFFEVIPLEGDQTTALAYMEGEVLPEQVLRCGS